jgi:hypothetical protein
MLWPPADREADVRHRAIVILTALALVPRLAAAQQVPAPPSGEPAPEIEFVAPRLLDSEPPGLFGARRQPGFEPIAQRRQVPVGSAAAPPPSAEPETVREVLVVRYTDAQLQLARDARVVYSIGVAAGLVGIAPFLVAFLYESTPTGLASAYVASALWTTEPVLMLLTDLLIDRARGRGPSAANVAGWIMLGLTVALGVVGGALELADVNEDTAAGLAISGAFVFFPMQFLTDALGVRAMLRAQHILRNEVLD